MVEVEKKFLLSDKQKTQLLDGAEFLYEKVITDSYLDDNSYSITKADLWLRQRDGVFELKAPLLSGSGSYDGANRYRELTTENEIVDELALSVDRPLKNELGRLGILPFVTCHTTRQSYSKEGFTIDIDSATYKNTDFTYSVAEIELLAEDESQADAFEERIMTFAKLYELETSSVVLGKIAAYLQRVKPSHYQALVNARVFK